jgi:hypothetical protein
MAQRDRENRVTLPSVKINFTERSVSHDEEKEKTDSRGEERFQGMVTFTLNEAILVLNRIVLVKHGREIEIV